MLLVIVVNSTTNIFILLIIFDPVQVLFVAFMMAFLAGSILLNVFREELPNSNLARFRWFIFGVFLITLILLLQTWIVMGKLLA